MNYDCPLLLPFGDDLTTRDAGQRIVDERQTIPGNA